MVTDTRNSTTSRCKLKAPLLQIISTKNDLRKTGFTSIFLKIFQTRKKNKTFTPDIASQPGGKQRPLKEQKNKDLLLTIKNGKTFKN